MSRATHTGTLPGGARYSLEVPGDWNGVLLLYSMPIPVGPEDPPWPTDDRLIAELTEHGYAVAGTANTIFWPLESVFAGTPQLLEVFTRTVGAADRTIGFGFSIGGIISAGLVQRFPGLLTAALPMCGNLAGAVAIHNRELDISFVVSTLLAPDDGLELVDITAPDVNVERAHGVLAEAQRTATGRARLALAAAIGGIPGWHNPTSARPTVDDLSTRLRNQIAWFEEPGFLVYFGVRSQVERQAGGNPSWNTGVDYTRRLATSIDHEMVAALYADADRDLDEDLEVLAGARRVEADPEAVTYLERHIVFNGELTGVPVLTVHTDGDGLVTPDNEHAYADVVGWAGDQDLLRQLYVHRGGHCSFTVAEVLTALDLLRARLDDGAWPALDPTALRADAERRGERLNVLRSGEAIAPAFFEFEPPPFPRRYDVRDTATDERPEAP